MVVLSTVDMADEYGWRAVSVSRALRVVDLSGRLTRLGSDSLPSQRSNRELRGTNRFPQLEWIELRMLVEAERFVGAITPAIAQVAGAEGHIAPTAQLGP